MRPLVYSRYTSTPSPIIVTRLTRSGHCTSLHLSAISPFVLQASFALPQFPGSTSFESGSRESLNHHASGFGVIALSSFICGPVALVRLEANRFAVKPQLYDMRGSDFKAGYDRLPRPGTASAVAS